MRPRCARGAGAGARRRRLAESARLRSLPGCLRPCLAPHIHNRRLGQTSPPSQRWPILAIASFGHGPLLCGPAPRLTFTPRPGTGDTGQVPGARLRPRSDDRGGSKAYAHATLHFPGFSVGINLGRGDFLLTPHRVASRSCRQCTHVLRCWADRGRANHQQEGSDHRH